MAPKNIFVLIFSASAQEATCRFDRINRKSGRKNEKRTKAKRIARKTLILSVFSVTLILSMCSVTLILSVCSVTLILSVLSVSSILSEFLLTFRYLRSLEIYFLISEYSLFYFLTMVKTIQSSFPPSPKFWQKNLVLILS